MADESSLAEKVKRLVQHELIDRLILSDGPTFSRARAVPRERRVRVLQTVASVDRAGRAFVPFAIDVRHGSRWREDDTTGCAYVQTGALYVKLGDEYRPAAALLGRAVDPVAGVCTQGAPAP